MPHRDITSESAPARAAQVVLTDAMGRLAVRYADGGRGGERSLQRPFVGGLASGLHSVPQIGDWVAVHHEVQHHPFAVTSVAPETATLTTLLHGETIILHPDGRQACYLQNTGDTVMLRTPVGVLILVDAQGNITLSTPGRVDLNVGDPSNGGGAYVNGELILTYKPV